MVVSLNEVKSNNIHFKRMEVINLIELLLDGYICIYMTGVLEIIYHVSNRYNGGVMYESNEPTKINDIIITHYKNPIMMKLALHEELERLGNIENY